MTPDHHPAYSEGVRVNEACTEARRIIEAAREGRRLGGYDKARTDPTTHRGTDD